jgi:hypothetical protein
MVSSEKGDTYDNRGYGFRSEYQTTFGRLGAFYRTWDDEEANTRIYSTFEALPRLFSGIIRYQSRTPTKTDTSFLTPPFGFALFYLRGVAPKEVTTGHIYRGVIPFVLIQVLGLLLLFWFPWVVTIIPNLLAG